MSELNFSNFLKFWEMNTDNSFFQDKFLYSCINIKKRVSLSFFPSKIPVEDAVNFYLKPNLVNLINKSFATRCLKRITEAITSHDS